MVCIRLEQQLSTHFYHNMQHGLQLQPITEQVYDCATVNALQSRHLEPAVATEHGWHPLKTGTVSDHEATSTSKKQLHPLNVSPYLTSRQVI